MPTGKQSDESERQREVIEKAFEDVEAVLRREGVDPTERFFSAKELTLLGVISWGEALASIEGEYSGPPVFERSAAGLPLFPSSGRVITLDMVREAEEEYDLFEADREAGYRRQIELSCQEAERKEGLASLECTLQSRRGESGTPS
jgi:hypothetical protein